jgi:uncharacterized surface anchored protein
MLKNKIYTVVTFIISIGLSSNVMAKEIKYLCISDASGGVIHKGNEWHGTSYRAGIKYIIAMENGRLASVKEFGTKDEFAMKECNALEPTKSFVCMDNFDIFRFQPSTNRFVMAKTLGYTSEFQESGVNLPADSFTPNIQVGLCESF